MNFVTKVLRVVWGWIHLMVSVLLSPLNIGRSCIWHCCSYPLFPYHNTVWPQQTIQCASTIRRSNLKETMVGYTDEMYRHHKILHHWPCIQTVLLNSPNFHYIILGTIPCHTSSSYSLITLLQFRGNHLMCMPSPNSLSDETIEVQLPDDRGRHEDS